MNEHDLLKRITYNPEIFNGKPIIRWKRLAVEHILGILAAGDDFDTILSAYEAKDYPDHLRRVGYYDKEKQRRFDYLTNNFEVPALAIADIFDAAGR